MAQGTIPLDNGAYLRIERGPNSQSGSPRSFGPLLKVFLSFYFRVNYKVDLSDYLEDGPNTFD